MSDPDYGPFSVDGRSVVNPVNVMPGTNPIPIRASQARILIDRFEQGGQTNHSVLGALTWVIVTYCRHSGIAYAFEAYPGLGYQIKKLPNPYGSVR